MAKLPPETEADRLRQQITGLRHLILAEIRLGMVPGPRVETQQGWVAAPSAWTLSHHHRLADLQAKLARKEAELALLLRLEQGGGRAQRGYAAKDDAIAREVLAENAGSTVSLWELAKRHAHRLPGDGNEETKRVRLRKALERVKHEFGR